MELFAAIVTLLNIPVMQIEDAEARKQKRRERTRTSPIFFDETRRRWSVFSALMIALSLIVALGSRAFWAEHRAQPAIARPARSPRTWARRHGELLPAVKPAESDAHAPGEERATSSRTTAPCRTPSENSADAIRRENSAAADPRRRHRARPRRRSGPRRLLRQRRQAQPGLARAAHRADDAPVARLAAPGGGQRAASSVTAS